MQFLNRYKTVYNLVYINRSLISFYPNSLKQIVSSMNYSVLCTKCRDMGHTVHFYSRSINNLFLGYKQCSLPHPSEHGIHVLCEQTAGQALLYLIVDLEGLIYVL